jgi:hypothetical protein
MAYRKDWGQPQAGNQGFARTMKCFGRKANIAAADVGTTGNVVGLFSVPANFVVLGVFGSASALGAALVFSLGDAGNAARYLTGVTAGAAGGALPTTLAAGGQFFRTTQDTDIQMTVTTQTGAPVAGTIDAYLWGFIL